MKVDWPLVLAILLCCSSAAATGAPPPEQVPQPEQMEHAPQPAQGFEVVHVPVRRSPEEQRAEDWCVRATGSHAALARSERQTKGTRGTHGECAGQGFTGTNNDVQSGLRSPAIP